MIKLKYSSLVFISGNRDKHREYCKLFGFNDLKLLLIPVTEPQSLNIHVIVEKKIEAVRLQLPAEVPFFVEHTALMIEAWKGLPGGLTPLFMNTVGNEGICKMMSAYKGHERVARAKIVVGYFHHTSGEVLLEGEITGTIAQEPRGAYNFGWDPIFIPDGDKRTYGEMTVDEKNETSMRKEVALKLLKYLSPNFEL
jgi:non-canonical purine NTP pyrophosphatase (RdgB/HAM1 family)